MANLKVKLFGAFRVWQNGQPVEGIDSGKAQELFCYLLLFRNRPHSRETLAGFLWRNRPTSQAKKYLRQAIWQIHTTLESEGRPANGRVLLVDPDWIRLNPDADLWLDVACLEKTYMLVRGVPGRALDTIRVQAMRSAADAYTGHLLEGWFQDWCLLERERLQNVFLATLDKLMDYCEVNGDYEAGLADGARVLAIDLARERTHRRLMRLYYLYGDRTAALRQYDRCVHALHEELTVEPAPRTVELYEQMRAGRLVGSGPSSGSDVLDDLQQLRSALDEVQRQLRHHARSVELIINDRD